MKVLSLVFGLLLWGVVVVAPATGERDDDMDVGKFINAIMFYEMFKHQKDPLCQSQGFYSYEAFLAAARYFANFRFVTTGKLSTRKIELAAFLALTSHQTTGGWPTAPDGPLTWGYCYVKEITNDSYCNSDPKWPCAPPQKYYGRGPMQLQYNNNYGEAGKALGLDLLKNPDLVAKDPVVSFKTAIWFWMTPEGIKPSCHDVMIGKWKPTKDDIAARRLPGFGVTTNVIAGGTECGHDADTGVLDRFEFYEKYCKLLNVKPGKNLECYFQVPFTRT